MDLEEEQLEDQGQGRVAGGGGGSGCSIHMCMRVDSVCESLYRMLMSTRNYL